jgi:hypothetical protein
MVPNRIIALARRLFVIIMVLRGDRCGSRGEGELGLELEYKTRRGVTMLTDAGFHKLEMPGLSSLTNINRRGVALRFDSVPLTVPCLDGVLHGVGDELELPFWPVPVLGIPSWCLILVVVVVVVVVVGEDVVLLGGSKAALAMVVLAIGVVTV